MSPNPPRPEGLRRSISRVSSRVNLCLRETFASSPPTRSNSRSRNDVQPQLSALRHAFSESNYGQPLPSVTPSAEARGRDPVSRADLREDLPRASVLVPAEKGHIFRFEAPRPSRPHSPFTSVLPTGSVSDLHFIAAPIPRVAGNGIATTLELERAVETSTIITLEPPRRDSTSTSSMRTVVPATSGASNAVPEATGGAVPEAQDPSALESPIRPASDLDDVSSPVAHAPEVSTIIAPEPQRPAPVPSPVQAAPGVDAVPTPATRPLQISTIIAPEPQRPDPPPLFSMQALVQATGGTVPEAQDPGELAYPASPASDIDTMSTPIARAPVIPTTIAPEPQPPTPTPLPAMHALLQATGGAFSTVPRAQSRSPIPGSFASSPASSVEDLSSTQSSAPHTAGNAVGNSTMVAPKPRRGPAAALVQATSSVVGMPRTQPSPYREPISRATSPAPYINVQSPGPPTPSRLSRLMSGTEIIIPGLLAPDRSPRTRASDSSLKSSLYPRSSSPSNCSPSTEDLTPDTSLGTIHAGTISRTSLDAPSGVSSAGNSRPLSASSSPGRRSFKNLKETTWSVLVNGLRTLDRCTGGCPTINEVIKGMVSCIDAVQESEWHRKEYDELAQNLTEMAKRLAEHHQRGNMTKMSDCTMSLMNSLQDEIKHVMKKQKRSAASRIAGAMGDREDLVEYYRRIEMLFSRLTNTRLDGLGPAKQAWYDCGIRRRACTPNTRQQILTELKKWANDIDSPKVFWLNGMAGTGKTTIAYSFCSELERSRQLGASFFCCRTLPECRDMARIIPTIAYQLARSSLPFQRELCEVLGSSPDMSARGISLQFERLMRDPLLEVKDALPPVLVVVIDALDECSGHDGAQPVLDALIYHARDLPVKFFVTCRPEPGVHNKLGSQDSSTREVMHLHNIEESLVQTDIETYLDEELGDIPESSEKVKMLASHAKNLFIYAATAVRYIKPRGLSVDPHERLETMLEVRSDTRSKKHEEIDALYSAILTAALADPRLEQREAETIRMILHTVICVREPMNAEALAGLLRLPNRRKVELALEPLRSVLHIPDSTGPVSTLHESFPDYMLNRDRSGEFFCDRTVHSELMVRHCFEFMKDSLRFNICGLESSFKFDADIHDLQKRIDGAISPRLFYACRYWGDHLEHVNPSSEILTLLDAFLSQQLLFWMEVLNLKGCVGAGGRILLQAHVWLEKCQASDQIRNLVLDARKFVVTFGANSASRSTPHIYVSALPFWSTTDPVWGIYGKRTRGLIRPQGTAMERRDRSNVAVWTLASRVMSIAVSSDSTRIASGSDDYLVRIWDLRNGGLVMDPLEGHTASVVSVAFSADATWVASGSNDRSVRIWDARTGRILAGPLESNSCVTSVAFSPHGNRVVSGSLDNTVRVWDARSGNLVAGPFNVHTDSIKSLAFSPQGISVASGSDDCSVRVWDFRDGSVVAGPFQAHGKPINSVAFSPDGALVASGANDNSICIWDAKYNGAVSKMAFRGHTDQVTSVAFSPNGAYVASGSCDRTVRVWSLRTRDIASGPFKGHTDTVTSVAFTSDGTCVVSGSHDKTIRIWDLRSTYTPAAPLEGHTDQVCSIAFSPNGTRFVSSSLDSTIRIWDARSGSSVAGPFIKAGGAWANSVSFSPKGSRIALGFNDGTVCIRDSQSGKHQVEPFTGHAGWITSVGFSPNGHRIVSSSSEGDMFIWSARTGRILSGPLRHVSGSPIRSAMFSPDGKRVVSSSDDGTICLWDARNGQRAERQFNGHEESVRSVAFSPSSNHIVSGSDDCTIRIWDARTGMTAVGPLQGHTGPVSTVAFSPDGALVASGSHDHTICVWNAKSGALTAVLRGHTGCVNSIAFSPDSAHIVSGSSDLTIRLWGVSRLLSNTTDISKDWTMGDDGWVVGRDKQVLLWVPNDLRTGLMRPQNSMIVYRRGSLQLNLNDALVGERWAECYVR
ncbi:hypothetical protein FRC10_008117 [Ceratobasidium sp. 414]|nr:hypothetical protein FRC10_008117 [Ceratobasidium sp. 414]